MIKILPAEIIFRMYLPTIYCIAILKLIWVKSRILMIMMGLDHDGFIKFRLKISISIYKN